MNKLGKGIRLDPTADRRPIGQRTRPEGQQPMNDLEARRAAATAGARILATNPDPAAAVAGTRRTLAAHDLDPDAYRIDVTRPDHAGDYATVRVGRIGSPNHTTGAVAQVIR